LQWSEGKNLAGLLKENQFSVQKDETLAVVFEKKKLAVVRGKNPCSV
jgi:hypothetical protein